MKNEFYIIDWSKVSPGTIDMLASGQARIIKGVARNISKPLYPIIEHIPFVKAMAADSPNLLKAAQKLTMVQTIAIVGIATVAIMGAIVLATTYLSKKLNNIQKQIDNIQKELHDQNIVYYADKIYTYFGAVEATREIITCKEVVAENNDLILLKISELVTLRNQLTSFLDNFIFLSDNFSSEHKAIAVDFINMTFNLLPKAIFIESQAAYAIDRFYLSDNIRNSAKIKYNNSINIYREWGNNKYQAILAGQIDSNTEMFQNKFQDIKALISSEENKLLLEHSA